MDLYKSLQVLLQDWPQLLKDFAAFLLPEQALACGLVSGCVNMAPWGHCWGRRWDRVVLTIAVPVCPCASPGS